MPVWGACNVTPFAVAMGIMFPKRTLELLFIGVVIPLGYMKKNITV
jgi:hypothetical protein